jgi:hypothetical protein
MSLPYTSKFYSNGTIFDSFGDINQNYASYYIDNNILYYINSNFAGCSAIDLSTESVTAIGDEAIYGIRPFKTIIVKEGNVYGYDGYDAKIFRNEYVLYVDAENENIIYFDKITKIDSELMKTIFIQSNSQIRDFLIDDDDNVYILHSNNKLSKYSKYREKIFSVEALSSLSAFVVAGINDIQFEKMDIVREYVNGELLKYIVVLGYDANYQQFLVKLDEFNNVFHSAKKINTYAIQGLSAGYQTRSSNFKINYNLTNYEYLRRAYKEADPQLSFNIKLKNIYNNRDITTVKLPVDISEFKNGEYHFAFRLDSKKGKIDLFIDGNLYASADIPKTDFTFQDITQDSFSVGATYFYNNITLFNHLKQKNNYIANNFSLKQFKLYNKSISNDEIKFLAIKSAGISDLVSSIPSGHRNALEQIERTFNVNTPGNKSNSVNIIIKNSKITNPIVQQNIKNIILSRMNDMLPAGTNINNITFKNVG